jgi:hypothetical protein
VRRGEHGQHERLLADLERRLARVEFFAQSIDDGAALIDQDLAALAAKVEALSESLVCHQDNEGRHGR